MLRPDHSTSQSGHQPPASVNASLAALQAAGIVREMRGRKQDRVFAYEAFLKILTEGTEPLR
jgi:hypothetical protein